MALGNRPPIPGSIQRQNPEMEKLKGLRSGLNPTDAYMDVKDGRVSPEMSVTELLAKQGIDANAPGSAGELAKLFMKQMDNADPIKKMQQFAGGGAGGPAPPPPGAPAANPQGGPPVEPPPAGGAGFDRLMNRPT